LFLWMLNSVVLSIFLLSHFPTDIFTGFYCVKTSAIDLDFNMMCRMVSISVQTFFFRNLT